MAREKIKLEEEAISEILVAYTNLESKRLPTQASPQQTLASEVIHPTVLSSVFFLQPEKEQSI